MPTLALPDAELFYEVEGQGPALLLLHGLGTTSVEWGPQRAAFADRFRVLTPDLRGVGRTVDRAHPKGPFSIGRMAADVRALLDHLGVGRAHVVGWSMGGMVALQLAVDAPDRVASLVIVNSGPDWRPRGTLQWIALRLRGLVTALVGPGLMARALAGRLFPRPEQAPLREAYRARMERLDKRAYAALLQAIVGWSVADRLGRLTMPTTVLASDGDYTGLARQEAWVARVPAARLCRVRDSRHALPLEEPERLNGLLAEHLGGLAGLAGSSAITPPSTA